MSVWIHRFFVYLLALSTITVLYIYILDIPGFISQAPDLIKEYYYR